MEPDRAGERPMDMGDLRGLRAQLMVSDGVITAAQAAQCGLSPRQVDHRLRSGEWIALARGVYLSAAHEFSEAARLRAAVLATGGIASGPAAAWWHAMVPELASPVTVTVPLTAHRDRRSVVPLARRRRALLPADVEVVRGLPVTGVPLTLLDCIAPVEQATTLLDRSLQTGAVTVAALRAALDRNAGRHGMAAARRVIAVVESDTESVAERRFERLLRLEGISGWQSQFPCGRYRADFAWPEEMLVAEVDGWAFHRDGVRFQADHDKRNALARAGWTVLSFTWHDVTDEPIGTVEAVVDVLRSRRVRVS